MVDPPSTIETVGFDNGLEAVFDKLEAARIAGAVVFGGTAVPMIRTSI